MLCVQAALDGQTRLKQSQGGPGATLPSGIQDSYSGHMPAQGISKGQPLPGTAAEGHPATHEAALQQLLGLSHQFRIAALTNASKLLPVRVFASFLVFSSGLEEASAHLAECLGRDAPATVRIAECGPISAPTVE